MFNIDKIDFKQWIMHWLRTYHYFNENGTLEDYVDYEIAYDMKPDIEDLVDMHGEEFDTLYDEFVEDTLCPILRQLGAIYEEY